MGSKQARMILQSEIYIICYQYSRTSTNGHLPTLATLFVPADSPDIDSYLNLSTMATTKISSQQRPVFSATDKSEEWS